MKRGLHVIDNISHWSGRLVMYPLLVLIAVMVYEVVARYAFNSPTVWAHESAIFIFGGISVLGGAYVLRYHAHTNIDVIYGRFPPRVRAILDIVTFAFFFLFIFVLVWVGGERAWLSVLTQETTDTPWAPIVYPLRVAVPVGAFLLLLQGVAKLIRDFRIAITGTTGEEDAT